MTQKLDPIRLETLNEIKVFSDPYRMLIFQTFDRLNKPATIKEVADTMGEVPAKVYYHAKKLISIGVLELDHEKNINGIIAKYYVPTQRKIIVSHESIDDKHLPSMMSETEKMLARILDDARSEFMGAVKKKVDDQQSELDGEKGDGGLIYTHLHLTQDEADEFFRFIENMVEKRKEQQSDEQKPYMFIGGLIQSEQG